MGGIAGGACCDLNEHSCSGAIPTRRLRGDTLPASGEGEERT
jgi:hypothetical protein